MNKKESLAFLQSCIDSVNMATSEEISVYQELYTLNCIDTIISSDFEFIPPIDIVGELYETNESLQIRFSEKECLAQSSKIQWNYNLEGIFANNEQNDENLPFAA